MAKKDAEITVGADVSLALRGAEAIKNAWGKIPNVIKESMLDATRSMVTNLADVALAAGKVNFSSQHESVKQFEASTARMAVSMGRDLETVRSSLEATGKAIGKRPGEVAAWVNSVGQLTYNIEGASKAIGGMSALAAQTGRSVDDYKGLAATLGTVGNVAGDTTRVLGVMQAQADKLGVSGGIAAFADQIQGLGGVLSHFKVDDITKVTGAAAGMVSGLPAHMAGRVQQGAFGALAADPMGWGRFVGHSIVDDKTGQVKGDAMKEIVAKFEKNYGKNAATALRYNFGVESGTALHNWAQGGYQSGEGIGPSDKMKAAQGALLNTDAGKRDSAAANLDISSRQLMGSATALGKAADMLEHAASSGIGGMVGTTLATGVAGSLLSTGLTKLGSTVLGGRQARGLAAKATEGAFDAISVMQEAQLGGTAVSGGGAAAGAGAAATGSAIGLAASAALVVGAGAVGVAIGTAIEKTFDISGKLDKAYAANLKGKDDEAFHADREKDGTRVAAMRKMTKQLRGESGLSPEEMGKAVNTVNDLKNFGALTSGDQNATIMGLFNAMKAEGRDDASARRIAEAIRHAMKDVKLDVKVSPNGPIEDADKSSESSSSGTNKL